MFDIRGLNIVVEVWSVVFCVVGVVCMLLFTRVDKQYRNLLVAMFMCELVSAGGDALAGIFRGQQGDLAWVVVHVGNLSTFVGSYGLLAAFSVYLCARLKEATGVNLEPWGKVVMAIGAIWVAMVALGVFYTIDDANIYHRTDLFWLAQVPAVLVCAVNFALVLFFFRELGATTLACFMFYTVAPLLGSLAQSLVYGFNFVDAIGTTGLVVLFLEMQAHTANILVERSEELARARAEAAESRIAVMVSQIQPHFLFNTLDSIYYLSAVDPPRSREAIDKFSTYLRSNLESLDRTEPVPISTEIAHVRTYLDLEKMSKDELLNYEIYDSAGGFSVPALSVQTLVENAVRHGVGKKPGGGTVVVRVSEGDDNFLVSVIDDGVGFSVESESAEGRHVGVENTRARLAAMCGGDLDIESEPGRGTTATLRIPKEARQS